eukprot:TRINITY_DN3785_c0_g1_i3.p2 TRINITY_DN3785_c0_g1~~TRINITY_DN3785_c0_g1_i3.p2  ORF type:complete len:189 (+),score=-6.54 TRINITY_DN3785_c0_g1_i3:691-1257(+)
MLAFSENGSKRKHFDIYFINFQQILYNRFVACKCDYQTDYMLDMFIVQKFCIMKFFMFHPFYCTEVMLYQFAFLALVPICISCIFSSKILKVNCDHQRILRPKCTLGIYLQFHPYFLNNTQQNFICTVMLIILVVFNNRGIENQLVSQKVIRSVWDVWLLILGMAELFQNLIIHFVTSQQLHCDGRIL